MIKDLLKGFYFKSMGAGTTVHSCFDKTGSIRFICYSELDPVEISLSDLKRLAEHINAEHLAVSEINFIGGSDNDRYEIIVKYRLY